MWRDALTIIEIEHLSKHYGSNKPLHDLCLQVNSNEVVALLAPSGSGKTTLLRCLAGLEQPTSGRIHVHGRLGLVLQHLHLFPHMSVLRNVTYAPVKAMKQPITQVEAFAHQLLDKMGLKEKVDVLPAKLSGGQRQRVAIARALAVHPDVLLLDEPTSALDHARTQQVWNVIQEFLPQHSSIVLVTHDTKLAHQMAHRVLLLHNGQLQPAC